jgi:hypothetical protein
MLMNTPANEDAGIMQSMHASRRNRIERNSFIEILRIFLGAITLPGK